MIDTGELRFTPHTPNDLIFKQYGEALMAQYPETEWERRIELVPVAYRDYIRARIRDRAAQEKPDDRR